MNHKVKKRKKKRSRELEDEKVPQSQINVKISKRQRKISDNFSDFTNVTEMKQDLLVESKISENDGAPKCKKKRKDVDISALPTDEILEIKNIESLNKKMHVEKARRGKLKGKTDNGLSCDEEVSSQVQHNVRLMTKDSDQSIEVKKQDNETNVVRKRKKNKRKRQSSNGDLPYDADVACSELIDAKHSDIKVKRCENDFMCSLQKWMKVESTCDLDYPEKTDPRSDNIEERESESINGRGKCEDASCNGDLQRISTHKVEINRKSAHKGRLTADIDLDSDDEQAGFIFPNIHGSDDDGSSCFESNGQDNPEAVEHNFDPLVCIESSQ